MGHAGRQRWRVPRFEPFAALRYSPELPLDDVTAPPYDVLSDADVDALAARHPRNIVRVDVPRESDGDGRYEHAAQTLRAWVDEGAFRRDAAPTFTIYRMRFTDEAGRQRETAGVFGALEVVDEGAGGVLPHERTTPKAKTDRLDLTRATCANLSPVWGLSLAGGLSALLREPGTPHGTNIDPDGVEHVVESVSDPARVAAISAAVSSAPVLIADGHHRYAISRTYRDERRAATGRRDGPWETTMTYVAELVDEQLSIAAIHRLITGVDAATLLDAFAPFFTTVAAGPIAGPTGNGITARLESEGALCLVDRHGEGTFLVPRPEAFTGERDLDSVRLEKALAAAPGADVTYQHGVDNVLGALASGAADTAVLIRPVGLAEIERTAREGVLMPPKSTFFTPKLRTGLVVRELL